MTDAVWHEIKADAFAKTVADYAERCIVDAIAERGAAIIAVPGGGTPGPALKLLAARDIDWKRLTILPGDDRQVRANDPLSNFAMVREIFGETGARLVGLADALADAKAAGRAADTRLADLPAPFDLVWLGAGGDGHTASIFPGPDYEEALTTTARALGVTPDPLPPEAPVARVTLSAHAISSARAILLTITGNAKRDVVKTALAQGADSVYPVGRVLARAAISPDIIWSAA
ncbi:MAG: 6-phosphogluconolactonase [Pacificimonas sp.]